MDQWKLGRRYFSGWRVDYGGGKQDHYEGCNIFSGECRNSA